MEDINNMKLCILSSFINEDELHSNDTWYHKEKGMHKVGNTTFAPLKKHPLYKLHKKWCELLGLKLTT